MAEFGEPLSERELDVLECVASGSSNREIARDLDISPNTVKVHLRNIYTKLGVSSRTEATTVALQKGVLAVPGVEVEAPLEAPPEPAQSPDAASAAVPSQEPAQQEQPAPTGMGSINWRLFSLALVGVLAIVLLILAASQLMGDDATEETAPAAETPFVEEAINNTRWSIARPLPQPRANMALAALGLNLYQIGGEIEAGVVNLTELYQTDTHQWRSLTSKPTAVADISAAVLGGEIYVPGGRLADGRPTAVVEVYSPANNAWRPVALLPRPVAGGLAMADGGLLYLFGGWDGEDYLDEAYVYDPAADSWQALPPMIQGRAFAAGGVLANELYVVGGYDGRQELADCHYFRPADSSWHNCPPLQTPRAGAGAAVLSNKLYILGGGLDSAVSSGEFFDHSTGIWEPVDIPMLAEGESWSFAGVGNIETRIYLFGGRRQGQLQDQSYIFAPFVYRTFIPAVGGDN